MSEESNGSNSTCAYPVLTVSVAAYNVERFLTRCLDSCIGFAPGQLDVIVVDDGSTDATGEIADRYAKKYSETFRVIHKENGHYGSTVNASLGIARGKYYRLLDSDDWFDREALDKWLQILSKTNADAVITSSMRMMEKSRETIIMDSWAEVPEGDYNIKDLPVEEVPGPGISNLAYRTDFLRNMTLSLLEKCNYVDEELRCIPWCHVQKVRVDHIPVYCVLKEREGQNTSFEGIRGSASDKARMFFHVMEHADLGEAGCRTKAQDMAFKVVIANIAAGYYYNMLLPNPSASIKSDIVRFDRELKEYWPEIYRASGRYSRVVRLLRMSKFALYSPIARRAQRKWRQQS